MAFELVRLLTSDGTWEAFREDWRQQCAVYGEDADGYACEPIEAVEAFAREELAETWAIGLRDDSRFVAMAMVNCTALPGYTGKVLRVRHLVTAPVFDLGELDIGEYADVLINFFFQIVKLSDTSLVSQHIKFHLRSPNDMMFFRAIGNSLDKQAVFSSVHMRGAWLYITKS